MGDAIQRSPIPLHSLLSFPSRLLSKHKRLRENHSFAVYAQAHLGTTIRLSFSRVPLIPLQGLAARLFSCPSLRFYSVWSGAMPNFAFIGFSELRIDGVL